MKRNRNALPPEDPSRTTPPESPDVHHTPLNPTTEDLIQAAMAVGMTREEAIAFHGRILSDE